MQHEPKITKGSDDEWQYNDGDVRAVISSDLKSYCQILEFTSIHSGKGNGRAAVEWMKREYQSIHINDPGNEIDAPGAFQFWRRLADSGLIESMIDGDSTLIFDKKEWLLDNLDPDDYPELYDQLTGSIREPSVSLSVQELVYRVRDEMIAEGYATDPQDINSGNCDAFADRLVRGIQAQFGGNLVNFGEREICDYFEDREASGAPLMRLKLLQELPDMTPPGGMTWDQLDLLVERAGMSWGLHVFVVYNGKAYDSETPEGVTSFFDLPIFQRILTYYTDKYGPLNKLERSPTAPGL